MLVKKDRHARPPTEMWIGKGESYALSDRTPVEALHERFELSALRRRGFVAVRGLGRTMEPRAQLTAEDRNNSV
jgi:hypothetical protein